MQALKKRKKKSKKQRGLAWNDKAATQHNWVFVSGLPMDVTEDELKEHFGKCGVIALDPNTSKAKIKIYRDRDTGEPKGDASIAYVKPESVDLCLQVLDEGQLRPSVVIHVERAKFTQKGEAFDPSKRRRVTEAGRRVAKAAAEQALAWNEDDDSGATGLRKGGLKIVVIEGMFVPSDFDDPSFEGELEQELAGELEQKVGDPEKITLFTKNPKGVVVIKFKTSFAAEECVKLMDGRYFAERKLSSYYWDGTTDFTFKEEEKEEQKRLDTFGDWIEDQELPEELEMRVEE